MKNAFKHVFWYIKENRRKYFWCMLMLGILSFIPVLPIRYLGKAIDAISSGTLTMPNFILYLSAIFLIPVMDYLINIVYHYQMNLLGHKLSYTLRERYIAHLFDLDAKIYDKYTKGDLIARVTNDLNSLTYMATGFLQDVVYYGVTIVSSIVMMVFINPLLCIISISIMPFTIFYLNKKRLQKRKYYQIHREIYGRMTENVLESVEGVKTIRAYVMEERDYEKTAQAIDDDINSWWKILKFETLFGPLFELIYVFAYFITLSFGAFMVINSSLSTGDLIAFIMYIGMLYGPLIGISNVLNMTSSISIADGRYYEIMNITPEIRDEVDSKNIIKFSTIEFENVSFKYPFDEFDVIKEVSFSINSGETIGIAGPTGAGKSTLIRQILRQYNVTSGNIYIDGINIKDYKIEDVHNLVGYVPQDHILFRRSVDDNIAIGNLYADIIKKDKAMRLADFMKDLDILPEGRDTLVSELGSSLSGGQKQRLSIARALVKDPEILILDDSLSAVDSVTEANIIRNLKEDRKNKTNIIIAHRFSAIAQADKIIILQNGKITNIGTHKQLLSYDNWYKLQYLRQIRGDKYEDN